MPTVAGGPRDWNAWSYLKWGEALFRYCFVAGQQNTSAVSRIVVTPDDLAKATGDGSAKAVVAKDAFLAAIRCSPSEFRRRLSSASLVRGGWQGDVEPPFLAYLLFTCFAAASLDTATIHEGDFRERVRILLKHPAATSYPLPDLPLLWTAFAQWLGKRREEGAPYRALLLPDPGWMTRIGYSIRLAFPSRPDTRQLIALLQREHLGATPPTVHEILQLLDRHIRTFSSGFGEVYIRARRAYINGKDAPELQALWSAVLEVTNAATSPRSERTTRVRYQLFVQEDELLRADPFVLATAPASREHRVVFERLEDPIRDYQYLLRASDGSVIEITRMLLRGTLNTTLPQLTRSPLGRAVDQGVLLFPRDSNAIAELAESCPMEGAAVAVVRQSLSKAFLALLPDRTQARNSKLDGWVEIGPFELATLRRPTEKTSPQLMRVRALQPTTVGAQIRLAGGQEIDGGYLGLRGMLPSARCPGASEIIAVPLQSRERTHLENHRVPLQESSSEPDTFAFTFESGDLDGSFNLVAKHDDEVIASREIHFRSRVLSHDYAVPTDPQRWIIEASPSDVLAAPDGRDCFLAACGSAADDSLRLLGPSGHAIGNHESSEVLSVDDNPALDRLVEALAAVCASRKGIAESEFLELIEGMLQVEAGPEIWDVLRAWLEAGYMDALSRRHWRGRIYFARRPRLVITRNDRDTQVVLHGLAPHSLRARAAATFDRMGATAVPSRVVSRTVGAPQTWSVASTAVAEMAAAELGLGALEHVKHFAELVAPLTDDALSSDAPNAYEVQGVWDWKTGGFRKRRADKNEAISIEWLARQDRPDRFVVHRSNGGFRSTFSRNWALLIGYFWAKTPPFGSDGPTRLVRVPSLGPYLPLPVARAVVLRAHVVSGPIGDPSGDHSYAYEVATTRERDHLLHWAIGRSPTPDHPRHLAWLISALNENPGGLDAVAIPADLRHRLGGLADLPNAASVSKKRIPRRMLPLLRHTLDLVGA